jgi:hypothetical protein
VAFNVIDVRYPWRTIADIFVIRVTGGRDSGLPLDQAGLPLVNRRTYNRARERALRGEVVYCKIQHPLVKKLMLVSGSPARVARQALARAERDEAGWVSLPNGSRVWPVINAFKDALPKHVYVVKLY